MSNFVLIILAPLIGGLIYGFERIVRARMQNRIGPPLLQPYYDMFKLFGKKIFIVDIFHSSFAIMHFIALWLVVALLIVGSNLLYIIFLHLLSTIFLILGGYSAKSSYSHIGANRELISIIAYEPVLIMIACGFYMQNGTFNTSAIYDNGTDIFSLFLFLISFVIIIPIKLKKSPFDVNDAHQEIVGGVEVEYSGIYFEFLYMAKWLEYFFIYAFLFLFAGNSLIVGIVLSVVVFLLVNLVDNSTARVQIKDMMKIVILLALGLSLINIVGLAYV